MNKKQLDSLSSSLSKAINPAARKIEATAKILERVEPLAILSKASQDPINPMAVRVDAHVEADSKERDSPRSEAVYAPVENTPAKMTTVAKTEALPTPLATLVKMATVAELATHANLTTVDNLTTLAKLTGVKGELRLPNTILDRLLPTLEPAAALLYLRLYRLSHGYKKETCIVGLQKLATATNTSERTVQRAVEYLERRGLISREGASFGGSTKGIQFRVRVPSGEGANLTTQDSVATVANLATKPTHANLTTVAKMTTLANLASNKDDDLLNTNHHQSANDPSFPQPLIAEPQHARSARRESYDSSGSSRTSAAATRVSESPPLDHLAQTITVYTTITKNPWLQADTVTYLQHHIDQVAMEKVKAVIQTVFQRAESRVNSFAYFVKEILAVNDQRTLGVRRKALMTIIRRVRENHMGLSKYGVADLVFDVKNACAREGVIFDDDLFNEVMRGGV
jgi:DNA-binding Lrp family transcriptional regulator